MSEWRTARRLRFGDVEDGKAVRARMRGLDERSTGSFDEKEEGQIRWLARRDEEIETHPKPHRSFRTLLHFPPPSPIPTPLSPERNPSLPPPATSQPSRTQTPRVLQPATSPRERHPAVGREIQDSITRSSKGTLLLLKEWRRMGIRRREGRVGSRKSRGGPGGELEEG